VRPRPIYGKIGDANTILCYCPDCGHLQYVEEHGIDGCDECARWVPSGLTFEEASKQGGSMVKLESTPLENIPYSCRNMAGTHMIKRPQLQGKEGQ